MLRAFGRTPLPDAALRAQARRGDVPQRLVARLRRRRTRVAVVGDVLPGAGGGGVRRRAGRGRRRGLQGAPAGGGVPPRRPAARRGVGTCWPTLGRRSWCTPAPDRSATTSPGRRRWRGCWRASRGWCWSWRISARPRARSSWTSPRSTTASTSTPRWCSPTSSAVPARPAAAAGRAGATDPARHRLPEHPVPLRPPARGPGPARSRRRLAARGVLGERSSPVRRRPGPDKQRKLADLGDDGPPKGAYSAVNRGESRPQDRTTNVIGSRREDPAPSHLRHRRPSHRRPVGRRRTLGRGQPIRVPGGAGRR